MNNAPFVDGIRFAGFGLIVVGLGAVAAIVAKAVRSTNEHERGYGHLWAAAIFPIATGIFLVYIAK